MDRVSVLWLWVGYVVEFLTESEILGQELS
jgi:hypothetical protein